MNRRSFLKILGVTGASAMVSGCVDNEVALPNVSTAIDMAALPENAVWLKLEDYIAKKPTEMISARYDAKQPVVVTWNPEKSQDITIDISSNALKYNNKVVLRWEKGACVFGTDNENRDDFYQAIPLSVEAIKVHPLHKSHIHPQESYAWLDKFHEPGSAPALQEIPSDFNPSYCQPEANDFKKQYNALYTLRQSSFEYRRLAYDNAYRSLRHILDWRPANARLLNDRLRYDGRYNHLLAATARIESGEGYISGPNPLIVNLYGFSGLFQMGNPALTASPLMVQGKDNSFCWTAYEVSGGIIKSRDSFLHSIPAQILAMHNLLKANHQNIYALSKEETNLSQLISRADTSGVLMAAHLVGASGAKKALLNMDNPQKYPNAPKDRNNTKASDYYKTFSGFPTYPYHLLQPNQKIGVEGFTADNRNRQR